MKQETIGGITASSLTFEGLEPHFRGKIREGMPERIRKGAASDDGDGHGGGLSSPGPRGGGEVRQPSSSAVRPPDARGAGSSSRVVPARALRGGSRAGAAGPARRERPPVGQDGGPAEGAMAGGARGMGRPGPVGSGAGVPVGGWGVRESRAGEGEGGASGGHGGAVRREEGDSWGGSRAPGVDGELVGSVAGPFVPRSALPETDCRRRTPWDLGRGAQRVPGGL